MGFSTIVSSRVPQSGVYQSQTVNGVTLNLDTDTGSITSSLAWNSINDGQAFVVTRGGSDICVRCAKSVNPSSGVLNYYRLYLDNGNELATDIQIGDTISLYEQPELIGSGSVLSSISTISGYMFGSSDYAYRNYVMGNTGIDISGCLHIPSKTTLIFGTSAPGQTIRIQNGGKLALGWYRTRSGVSVFNRDLLIRGTKAESSASSLNNSLINQNTVGSRFDWFGGIEESGSTMCDVAGATTRIYSKYASTRGLGKTGVEEYQIRATSSDWITYGFTSENRTIVLVGNASFGGYVPRQQNMAFSFSSSSPVGWLTITDPVLKGGNVLDVGFWNSKWARIINNETGSDYIAGGNSPTSSNANKGLHEVRQNVTFSIVDLSSNGISGAAIFCRDSNSGIRLGPNKVATNYDYTTDFTYFTTTDNVGSSTINSSGGILLCVTYQNTGGAKIGRFTDIHYDYRGIDNSNTDRFKFGFCAYGYIPASYVSELKGTGGSLVSYTMLNDTNVSSSLGVVPTYSSLFNIDNSGNVVVTNDATLDQLYDYAAYWLTLNKGSNMEVPGLGNYLITPNGNILNINKNVSINPGVTLSNGSNFTILETTQSLNISGNMNITSYVSPSGTYVQIGATGVISGSRVQFYNMTDHVLISTGIRDSIFTEYVPYTSEKQIRCRASYVNGISGYLNYEQIGILTETGLIFNINQEIDTIYNEIGIDGSTVSEFTADYPNIQIDISDPDQITSVQRLYAWYMYLTYSDPLGLYNFFGGVTAEDYYNYKINTNLVNISLDNTNPEPVIIYGARLYHSDGTTVIASGSNSIQMDPDKAYLANSTHIQQDLTTIKNNTNLIPALL